MGAACYRLSPNINVVQEQSGLYLVGETEAIRLSAPDTAVQAAVAQLARGATVEQVTEFLSIDDTRMLLSNLLRAGLLITAGESAFLSTQFERHFGYFAAWCSRPDEAQRRLAGSRVAIIGLGGIGSVALQHLAGAGVGTLELVDDDRVELHNLNRQFAWRPADVGRLKCDAAADWVLALTPQCRVTSRCMRISELDDLDTCFGERVDLLVLAADEPVGSIERTVARWCERRGTAFTTAGVGIRRGYWGPLLASDAGAKLESIEARLAASLSPTLRRLREGAHRITPFSFGPTNTVVAAMMIRDALHHLAGLGQVPSLDARIVLDFATLETERVAAGGGDR